MKPPVAGRSEPPHVQALNRRIANEALRVGRAELRIRCAVANTVVGQVLPPGVVKGGTALKLRVGEPGSRFTPDFGAARYIDWSLDDYVETLESNLRTGWAAFTGRVVHLEAPTPADVPADYVMVPFDLKLENRSRPWLTVRFDATWANDLIAAARAAS